MKKIILSVILSSILITVITAQNGVLREITGNVELKHAGAAAFIPAAAGAQVSLNTIISTGFRSSAIVVIGSSTITVRPLTRLSLAEIQSSENSEKVNVHLQAGRVRVDIKPASGTRADFTVQSSRAIASVRGTSFEFDTVNLNVREGKVLFGGSSGGPLAMVNGGFFTYVSSDGTAENPVEVTAASTMPSAPAGSHGSSPVSGANASASGELTVTPEYN